MTQRKQRYFICILITLLSVLFCSCSDNPVGNKGPVNPIAIVITPMWPQAGYNAQNTSSPYAPFAYCNPVNIGEVDWYYNFGSYGSDGAEYCVDSKNNIYFLWQVYPFNKIYKFRPDGTVVWVKDSLNSPNHSYFSLSPDETKIYMSNGSSFICIDSSGHLYWDIPLNCNYVKPAVGKNGTIYNVDGTNLDAVNPDGSIKWTTPIGANSFGSTKIALDRDENVYYAGNLIVKVDKNGNMKWTYTPEELNFFAEGVVIDGFNNLYFINYLNNSPGFYSISKDGILRWKISTSSESPPVIDFKNSIYTIGSDFKKYDTSGNIVIEKQLPAGFGLCDYPIMDDKSNLYFLYELSGLSAASVTDIGELRWSVELNTGLLLPGPSLMPMGRMLVAPKRAGKIACVR